MEFSRTWNRPVHVFLLRHCLIDSMGVGVPRAVALQLTFYVSIAAHEAVLWAAFRRPTFPYLALCSLTQLPLADLMRVEVIQGRRLGNLLFWSGLTIGGALITVAYAQELAAAEAAAGDAASGGAADAGLSRRVA